MILYSSMIQGGMIVLFRLDDIADIGLGASTHGRSVVGQGESFMPIINIRDVRDGYIDYAGVEEIAVVDEQKTPLPSARQGYCNHPARL